MRVRKEGEKGGKGGNERERAGKGGGGTDGMSGTVGKREKEEKMEKKAGGRDWQETHLLTPIDLTFPSLNNSSICFQVPSISSLNTQGPWIKYKSI